jgi:hypothetical protein
MSPALDTTLVALAQLAQLAQHGEKTRTRRGGA